jgi:dipeptidyl aminopeptidase/acylaminoacyl peptidase
MKFCITFLLTIHVSLFVLSQTSKPSSTIISKPPIDSAAIANWADLLWSEPVISDNGRYFMYPIENLPAGSKTLVIQSTEGPRWKKQFIGANRGFFSSDNKLAVFKSNDTLYLLSLGKDKITAIPDVISYRKPSDADNKILAYRLNGVSKELVLRHLSTGKEQRYKNVADYELDAKGNAIVIKYKIPSVAATSERVEWFSLVDNKTCTIWQSPDDKQSSASRFSFDDQGKHLVFIVEDKTTSPSNNQIWYYKEGMQTAIVKVTNQTTGIDSGMIVSDKSPYFSKNGNYIFFKIQPLPKPPLPKPDPNAVQVDVWSYKDEVMQNMQMYELKHPGSYYAGLNKDFTCSMSVRNGKVLHLEKPGISFVYTQLNVDRVISANRQYVGDKYWLQPPNNYYLISLDDENEKTITKGNCREFSLSNDGHRLFYFDYDKASYFSYDLLSEQLINISYSISEPVTLVGDKGSKYPMPNVGIAGWLDNDAILIYSNYDIWKVDVRGKLAPVNLTNGYGRVHHIKFRLLEKTNIGKVGQYSSDRDLLLTAFQTDTKDNGFYKINVNHIKDPEQLTLSPYLYCTKSNQTDLNLLGMEPVKALKANIWIVRRQAANEAPNFYLTKDFKSFGQLTNLQPQKKYNWYNTELLTWKQSGGENNQGIIYKPDNLDSTKKYPVIVFYYEKRSDQLREYLQPEFTGGDINIPWFVSRGYIIFVPDIYYTIGKTGESVVNSVVSGVRELSKRSYVDSTKIALQGQSFGGYETNYLVTHTTIFAAAVESAGETDMISNYGSILPDGATSQGVKNIHFDRDGQYRIQSTMWENLNAYIENSPIFNADKVTTPLLIMHNKMDFLVPWEQAVELFIGLRRLDKKAWMLQYDNGGHGLGLLKDKIDYTKRIEQFFNHYLKEAPAPKWMTKGIPAKFKGIYTGLDLDPKGNCSNDCKICQKINSITVSLIEKDY